jgi:predicted MFS family arabinose efflux permease
VFGWIWPLFGCAAALSTIVTSHLFGKSAPQRIWAYAHVVMALGVLLPALWPSLWAIALSALCVGTFMVITMAGMQAARAAAGANAPRLMSMMTASFAAG